ncbi:MAG: DUF4198 domain-containing protein [Thermoguttaceae bacterium]|nr:DUF4198 domain-containing protein [Thermoguttaceae bacterium]MDW8078648.1 DUF4198 domain-containing protein [Thermoguttaceae bacterium]
MWTTKEYVYRNKFFFMAVTALTIYAALDSEASGHFLVLLPSSDSVDASGEAKVSCRLLFGHPAEQTPPLPVAQPARVGVQIGKELVLLTDRLSRGDDRGGPVWTFVFPLRRPGDHVFFAESSPYWEPAERTWLSHSAKVVVQFGGAEVGWDHPVGLPVEIVPLTRPYGLWVGNCFRGQVLHRGKPAPGVRVEVEFWNEGRRVDYPSGLLSTQVLTTDSQGVFCYGIPWSGWWGFAALVEGESQPGPDGQPAMVELGGTIWIRAVDPPRRSSPMVR